ncbi:hypothetical protein F5148DRAFT_559128 [Russula earlei]|uniref:Uncharacterized protein n=1 Tax=Russula earlei TaxID=71964 RepID=A0ACC0UPB6_9AGAM|nr:hypothetical protein F5148DRAFT_559128 [Russula earlei]
MAKTTRIPNAHEIDSVSTNPHGQDRGDDAAVKTHGVNARHDQNGHENASVEPRTRNSTAGTARSPTHWHPFPCSGDHDDSAVDITISRWPPPPPIHASSRARSVPLTSPLLQFTHAKRGCERRVNAAHVRGHSHAKKGPSPPPSLPSPFQPQNLFPSPYRSSVARP